MYVTSGTNLSTIAVAQILACICLHKINQWFHRSIQWADTINCHVDFITVWPTAAVGNLFSITGHMNCALLLVGCKTKQFYPKILPSFNYEEERLLLTYYWITYTHLSWCFILMWCYALTWVMEILVQAISNVHMGRRFPTTGLQSKQQAMVKSDLKSDLFLWFSTTNIFECNCKPQIYRLWLRVYQDIQVFADTVSIELLFIWNTKKVHTQIMQANLVLI